MYVTNRRASAWLDQELVGKTSSEAVDPAKVRQAGSTSLVRYAVRPLQTSTGRCIALKLVSTDGQGLTAPRFFVLVQSSFQGSPRSRWLPLERVLSEAEAARWLANGFRP